MGKGGWQGGRRPPELVGELLYVEIVQRWDQGTQTHRVGLCTGSFCLHPCGKGTSIRKALDNTDRFSASGV